MLTSTQLTEPKENKVLRRMQRDVMLIRVTLKKPATVKKSARVAEEAAKIKGIDQGSVRASLTKMRGDNLLRHQKVMGEARAFLSFRSTPYGEDGWRMIQVKYLPDVMSKMQEFKMQAEELVYKIVNEDYESMVEDAKNRLGSEFEFVEFPSREQLAQEYSFEIKKKSFETGDDIRLQAASEIVKDIQHEMNAQAVEFAEEAKKDVVKRVENTCRTVVDTLENYGSGKAKLDSLEKKEKQLKAKIRSKGISVTDKDKAKAALKKVQADKGKHRVRNNGSAVENLKKLVTVIGEINVTGDEQIAKIGDTLSDLMEEFDGKNTKDDKTARRKCIETNKDILSQLKEIKLVRV